MIRRIAPLRLLLLAGALVLGFASSGEAADRDAFRVCADPNNLPFSHRDGTGFENRLAQLWARKLDLPLEYTWFPQRRGFLRHTLRAPSRTPSGYACDVVMGVVENMEGVITTRPYYRSTYVLAYLRGRRLDDVDSREDFVALPPQRKQALRVGAFVPTPGALWLSRHGMTRSTVAYPALSADPANYPGQVIETDLLDGRLDAVVIWGPVAGYFAKRTANAELVLLPLASEPGIRFEFAISAGVRYGEAEARQELDRLIDETRDEIAELLVEFNVPIVE